MKSWKTTLSGVLTILAGAAAGGKLILAGQLVEGVTAMIGAVSVGIGLINARDHGVSSEDAGIK